MHKSSTREEQKLAYTWPSVELLLTRACQVSFEYDWRFHQHSREVVSTTCSTVFTLKPEALDLIDGAQCCILLLQVLLVSSSRHPDKWIVPGGGMEPEEEPNVAAAREVCEEVSFFPSHFIDCNHSNYIPSLYPHI